MVKRPLHAIALAGLLALAAVAFALSPAAALVTLDFEAPYLVHPGDQIWDFSVVLHEDVYHVFYHVIPPGPGNPALADTIMHAVSTDLRHWEILGPALTAGPDWWDEIAIWAPEVVYDEQSQRWGMLYTGVAEGMVQRACLAWSEDMMTWTKAPENPVFEPDTLTYYWSPDMNWSSFRDPFLYRDDGQWNMLSTTGLREGGYPGTRRGIVHRAVSGDLVHWTDAGVFFAHDGEVGYDRDLESVQYIVRNSWHHLFFVEQVINAASHSTDLISAQDPADWTMADRIVVDEGWAPDVLYVGGFWFDTVFARLTRFDDPQDGTTFIIARFDRMSFGFGGGWPWITSWDPLWGTWSRYGEAGDAAPAFGENPILRGEPAAGVEGHGWFSSNEFYSGPLSGIGEPGAALGDSATGELRSSAFQITGGHMKLRVGGGYYPETCWVALVDADNIDEVLCRSHGFGQPTMSTRYWDLQDFIGRDVRVRIVDEEMGPDGWIAVDSIQELDGAVAVDEDPASDGFPPQPGPVVNVGAFPNPFNGGTEIRFDLLTETRVRVEVYDLAGRLIWRSPETHARPGEIRVPWDARDSDGRSIPSGVYLLGVSPDAGTRTQGRITHVK